MLYNKNVIEGEKSMASNELSTAAWRRARAAVLARESMCYLCGKPVDKSLPGSSPMGPTVDHTEARAAGGSLYDASNLHLAHQICNSKKGKQPLAAFRYSEARKQEHSREW